VRLEASVEDGTLHLVGDRRGPGFAPAMLAQFGKPYQSTKGRPGGGVGLFLVVNVARTLGGAVAARNRRRAGRGAPDAAAVLDRTVRKGEAC
jgi:two-component system sensor histidine kinase RegB